MVHRLGNLLRGSWHVVLDTLEQAAGLLVRRAIARPRWSPQAPETELLEVERHCNEVLLAAVRGGKGVYCSRHVTTRGIICVCVLLCIRCGLSRLEARRREKWFG